VLVLQVGKERKMGLKLLPSGDCAALDISKGRTRATARIKVCTRWRCIFNVNVEMKMNVTLESAQRSSESPHAQIKDRYYRSSISIRKNLS
jgi:hypothetical protein